MRANAGRWKVCQNLKFEAMEEFEILDKVDAILKHCIFCVDNILNGGEYIDSDGNICIEDTDEQIKICHRDIAALREDCNKSLDLVCEKINQMRQPEDIERYITAILSRCGTYCRTFYSADDLNFLQHHEHEIKNDRKRYNDLFNSYRECLSDDITEFIILYETGEQIKQYYSTGKPDLGKIDKELTEIVDFYFRLCRAIDAAALLGGVDFITLQSKYGIWICKEHNIWELIEQLGSAKRVRDLLVKAAGTGTEPQPEQPAFVLPPELDTDRAREYLNRAQEAGFIAKTSTGYKWTMTAGRGALAQLAYFCGRVYCPDNVGKLPETALNRLFGVSRIGAALTQANNARPQKWRQKIDSIFED